MNSTPSTDPALHLLLVDDSLEELDLLCAMLRAARFRLTLASDGRKGYQRAVVSQPDLILMDVVMPQLDGFSACRLLKADPATQHIPIIFLTAKNDPDERLRGLQLGGVDYVSKPIFAEEVIARVRIHLNRLNSDHTTAAMPSIPPMSQGVPASRHQDDVIFRAASEVIQNQLNALPPLPEIARMVGTHEKRLGHIFRDRLGLTVSAFAAEQRICLARSLLVDTDMSVQNISEQAGFGSAGNFATAFRKRMGMTPSAYRQALQKEGIKSP